MNPQLPHGGFGGRVGAEVHEGPAGCGFFFGQGAKGGEFAALAGVFAAVCHGDEEDVLGRETGR
jgi:hypothetical protein